MRTRIRKAEGKTIIPGLGTYPAHYEQELFRESSYPGSNNCHHRKMVSACTGTITGPGHTYPGARMVNADGYSHRAFSDPRLHRFLADLFRSVAWEDLPSSSKVGLIQLLAELDDSILIFTKKFWKELSYGSFTWGVLPFVNDLQALLGRIEPLINAINGDFSWENESSFEVTLPPIVGWPEIIISNGKLRRTGKLVPPAGINILGYFDHLGFHPDVSTAWDLVPFSFLVDYLFPIGDFLDNLSQRGWTRFITFDGWTTIKYEIAHSTYADSQANFNSVNYGVKADWDMFTRTRHISVLEVPQTKKDLDISVPTLRQMMNLLYVDRSNRGASRR